MLSRLKSFLRGMATVFDVWPAPRQNIIKLDNRTDTEKIAWDWQKVGEEIRKAEEKIKGEINEK